MIEQTAPQIIRVETDDQILSTYEVMRQLRPDFTADRYVQTVRALMHTDNYRLAALAIEDEVVVAAGYRFMSMLYCGKLLYLDDFVTDERARSSGYGKQLMDWLKTEAREHGCTELQLISRVTRERAHRFYFREGFSIECFHFRTTLG